MRKKTVDFDGEKFLISPMTFEQVEAFTRQEASTVHSEVVLKNSELICMGLNNALNGDADETTRWTPERCKKELDPELFWKLLPNAIITFSGLAIKVSAPTEGQPVIPGEAPAASKS